MGSPTAAVGPDLHQLLAAPRRSNHPRSRTRRQAISLLARLGAGATIASVTGVLSGVSGRTLAYAAEAVQAPTQAPTDNPSPAADGQQVARTVAGNPAASTPVDTQRVVAVPAAAPLVERLSVEQNAQFLEPIGAALDELSRHPDPRWADLVAQNLRVIRPARSGELPQGAFAGLLVGGAAGTGTDPKVGPVGGTAIFASTKADVHYLASVIVHEAWHYHQYVAGGMYYGRGAEQEAIQTQVDVLRALSPDHYALGYLEDSIAKVGDAGPLPGNPRR